MTLEQFVSIQLRTLYLFEEYYREKNKINPEQYPLDIPDDNAGLWTEIFYDFEE